MAGPSQDEKRRLPGQETQGGGKEGGSKGVSFLPEVRGIRSGREEHGNRLDDQRGDAPPDYGVTDTVAIDMAGVPVAKSKKPGVAKRAAKASWFFA